MILVENGVLIRHYMATVRNFNVYVGEVKVLHIWGDRAELSSSNTYSSWRSEVPTSCLHRTKESALKHAIPEMKEALEELEFIKRKLESDITAAESL